MSWQDRIKPAAYTSPGGTRMGFASGNVSLTINKRDSIREFTDYDGALVQNFGIGALSEPLLAVFSGDDHDKDADAFIKLLSEPGRGILEHPLYGRVENAVPFGPINRRDDLVSAANQSIFEVNFVQSAPFSFPGSLSAPSDQIEFDLDAWADAQASAYSEDLKIETASEKIGVIDSIKAGVANTKRFLGEIAATVEEIESEFNELVDSIQGNINTLVGQPLNMASKIIRMVTLPSRAAASISATLSAYQNLLNTNISQANGLFSSGLGNSVNNQFFDAELFSNSALAGMLDASKTVADSTRDVSGQSLEDFITAEPEETPAFVGKSEIISSIEFLLEQSTQLNNWNENNRASLDLLDTGASYTYLNSALAGVAGFLIEISFSSRQELIITLGSPRNLLELSAELYGVTDNALDFAILTNDLSGDEILELPRGFRFRYYV